MAKTWSGLFGSEAVSQEFTESTLNGFFDEQENDVLAGLGTLTARQKLIDRIVAQHNIVLAQKTGIQPRRPAPALRERTSEVASPVQLSSAKAAKVLGVS